MNSVIIENARQHLDYLKFTKISSDRMLHDLLVEFLDLVQRDPGKVEDHARRFLSGVTLSDLWNPVHGETIERVTRELKPVLSESAIKYMKLASGK